ncbi:hypothetical protein ACLKA6_016856 [Drosophila palustris]
MINSEVKEPDIPLLRENLQLLREEVGQLKKDVVEKESSIQQLRAEVDRQRINEAVQDSSIQLLKAEIERLAKKSNLRNCNEANSSGIHDIVIPNFSSQPFTVACDAETRGGGWTIILRRMDGSVDFNRTWNSYKKGFGELEGEFFLGLDKIHALTAERNQELLVLLEDQDGIEAFENYDTFAIGDEEEQYVLHKLGNASGSAGDSLEIHRGMKFSTFDRDNDIHERNCAKNYTGGWWYRACHSCLLTGLYNDNNWGKGVIWNTFRGNTHSLKKAVMMIRPKK